jgi:hypothetical protein
MKTVENILSKEEESEGEWQWGPTQPRHILRIYQTVTMNSPVQLKYAIKNVK